MKTLWAIVVLLSLSIVSAQNSTSLPPCASGCIAHATTAAEDCSSTDQKCLCVNNNYINTLSCCIATSCSYDDQQSAIEYNVEACNAVNETAPNFVGCSPLSLSSAISFNTATITSGSSTGTGTSMDMSMAGMGSNGLVTTVTGTVSPLSTVLATALTTTANWGSKSLLTGSCTVPFFAAVTDINGLVTEFPEVGCAPGREDCCPFDSLDNGYLTKCPQDYFTTAGACCPSGWQVYFTDLGGETPCYTMPSLTHVPASSPVISGITVITEHVFARKFNLRSAPHKSSLSGGAKAGIAIGIVIGVLSLLAGAALLWLRRRRAMIRSTDQKSFTVIREKSHIQSPVETIHELPSPGPQSPRGAQLPISSLLSHLPPAYAGPDRETSSIPVVQKPPPQPQELPGSYFIHQHHPAFAAAGGGDTATATTTARDDENEHAAAAPAAPPAEDNAVVPSTRHTTSPIVSPLESTKT